jgi:WLM domain
VRTNSSEVFIFFFPKLNPYKADDYCTITTGDNSNGTVAAMKTDTLISEYAHLKGFPREAEALQMLKKVASLVRPIMRQRGWRVGLLQEFYPPVDPNGHHLLGRV